MTLTCRASCGGHEWCLLAGTLCITRSKTEGRSWEPAVPMVAGPFAVEPKIELLANGLLVISTGRVGLFAWVSTGANQREDRYVMRA